MELPLGGPALRHYTQSRPRPHRQKLNYRPSRLQETIIECENEDFELMGRVDEGVEEFFTKKILPSETLQNEDDEEEIITVQEVVSATTTPCPLPTKTLRRKLGDFFTLRKKRGLKSEQSQEGRSKKASIADFIRPLRDVARGERDKDKDKVRENDKENEKEKSKDGAGESVQVTSDAPIPRGEAVPPRRALREGKSQSLILLSGSGSGASKNKKLDSQNSFEQKLHLMLQRIGVSKPHSGETPNQEGEMKKAESEGTIIDNKPGPPSAKPRTMSASSDTRHQLRSSVSAHESAGKPPLLPKPVIKPGPPLTKSGHNTPNNELGQIEGETNAQSTQTPEAAPSVSRNSTQTISDTAPDSATVLPSSQIESHICTESSVEAKAPVNAMEKDSAVDTEATEASLATAVDPLLCALEESPKDTTLPKTPTHENNLTEISTSALPTPPASTLETVFDATQNDNSTMPKVIEPDLNVTVIIATLNTIPISTCNTDISTPHSNSMTDNEEPCTLTSAESAITKQDSKIAVGLSEEDSIRENQVTVNSITDCTKDSSAIPQTMFAMSTSASSETPAFATCTTSPSTLTLTSTLSQVLSPVTSISNITNQTSDTSQYTTGCTASSPLKAISDFLPSVGINPVTVDIHSTAENETVSADMATLDTEHSDKKPEASVTENTTLLPAEMCNVVQMTEETNTSENMEKSKSSNENKAEVIAVISDEVVILNIEETSEEKTFKTNGIAVSEKESSKEAADEPSEDEEMNKKQQKNRSTDEK